MSAKRKADEVAGTDDIVQAALRQAEQEKKAKKQAAPDDQRRAKAAKKGLTLEELEAQEGGVIKESQVPMAKTRRSQQRSGRTTKDTDLVGDDELVGVEEALEQEEDDGMKLEPFNLAQERAEGFFDEGGHYVERRDEDEEERDAWFASAKESVVSAEVLRRIQERQQREAESEAAPAMSGAQAAALKRKIAAHLQRGETITEALKRLRPPPQRGLKRPKKGAAAAPKAEQMPEERANLAAFEEITESASALMDAGELDIYGEVREALERSAAAFPAEGEDDDMFGDDFGSGGGQEPGPSATPADQNGRGTGPAQGSQALPDQARASVSHAAEPQHAAPQAANGRATPTSALKQDAAEPEVDYGAWPIKELRRFLTERGQDPTGIVEKADLVARVKEAAASGPDGEVGAGAPPGFAFDPATGYFYSAEAGLYFDASSGGYFSSSTNKWYSLDAATSQYVEWPVSGP